MNVKINGAKRDIPQGITIKDILEIEKVEMPEYVTVELNEQILDREDFSTTIINENDSIEFLYYMGGGSYELHR